MRCVPNHAAGNKQASCKSKYENHRKIQKINACSIYLWTSMYSAGARFSLFLMGRPRQWSYLNLNKNWGYWRQKWGRQINDGESWLAKKHTPTWCSGMCLFWVFFSKFVCVQPSAFPFASCLFCSTLLLSHLASKLLWKNMCWEQSDAWCNDDKVQSFPMYVNSRITIGQAS